jgi:hypothetical protein
MRDLSAVVFATERIRNISWKDRVLTIQSHPIDINRYFEQVRATLQDLREFVHSQVLFNIDVAFQLPATDSLDEITHGIGLFADADKGEGLQNVDSLAFWNKIAEKKVLCTFDLLTEEIHWDVPAIER